MANTRKYKIYREVLSKLGLEQLDVYRYPKSSDAREVIRARDRSGRLLLIKLPRFREEMGPEEFEELVKRQVSG